MSVKFKVCLPNLLASNSEILLLAKFTKHQQQPKTVHVRTYIRSELKGYLKGYHAAVQLTKFTVDKIRLTIKGKRCDML